MLRGTAGTLVLIWLLIGVVAAWQRDYFQGGPTSCGSAGRIALTVIAGPLNYAGVNPKVVECRLPQPSSMGHTMNWQGATGLVEEVRLS